eukprot:TRINITY_DN2434_c0_g2_i1.p1 TRINITY_DN2434_c0_g2~~TRINITY_DN2434_c0_g2_i1.p1  ORF type:complete len:2913 (+),score=603.66 TRINITY_DN2434_c0_g2_i1:175-8913(+)
MGKLTLKIPWRSLNSKPAIVRIEKLFIVASPQTKDNMDSTDEMERLVRTKFQRLQIAELLGLDRPDNKEEEKQEEKSEDGFIAKLMTKVVDNLQIFIDDVHIRFEDQNTVTGKVPFVIGVTLDSLHVQSANENWDTEFISTTRKVFNKIVDLRNFAIYFNTGDACNFFDVQAVRDKPQIFSDNMTNLIPKSDHEVEHQFILQPVSGNLRATIDSGPLELSRPRISVDLEIDQIFLSLDSQQFKSLLASIEEISMYSQGSKYLMYRPKKKSPEEHPKKWWEYAINSVKKEATEANERWSWARLSKRKQIRVQYITLYKKRKKGEKMSSKETSDLVTLETDLEYDDIILYRKLANASIEREIQKQKEADSQRSWFGRMWGGKKEVENIEEADDKLWKELYEVIDYNEEEDAIDETVYPPDYVKTDFTAVINAGCLSLKDPVTREDIILARFDILDTAVQLRETSTSVSLSMQEATVLDYNTIEGHSLEVLSSKSSRENNLIDISLDLNPIDSPDTIDVKLDLKINPVYITFSRKMIDRIGLFFKTEPSAAMQELSEVANQGFSEVQRQASERIKYAIESKTKLLIHLDIAAPIIEIPQNFTDPDCPVLTLDLGNIDVYCNTSGKEQFIDHDEAGQSSVTEDYFYDKFTIKMTDLAAGITNGQGVWRDSMEGNSLTDEYIIEKFDLNIDVDVCDVPTGDLPNVKIGGELPSFKILVDKNKLINLMKITDEILTSTLEEEVYETEYEKTSTGTQEAVNQKVSKDLDKVMYGTFVVSHFSFCLQNPESKKNLIEFEFNDLISTMDITNHYNEVTLQLNRFSIIDGITTGNKMLVETPKDLKIIDITYFGTTPTSPVYEGVEHLVKGKFETLIVNVNRTTIAELIFASSDITNSLLEMRKDSVDGVSDATQQEEELQGYVDPDSKSIIFQMDLEMSNFVVNLLINDDVFINAQLESSTLVFSLNANSTMDIEGSLESVIIERMIEDGNQWRSIVKTQEDQSAGKWSYHTYNKDSKSYPGHDMKVGLSISEIEIVFLNSVVSEIITYFGVLTLMNETFSAVLQKTTETAVQYASSKIKLEVFMASPTIIVPVKSTSKTEYSVLSLGEISVDNGFIEKNGEDVDSMDINISKIFMKIIQNEDTWNFIDDTTIGVTFERPLSLNSTHAVPSQMIQTDISEINLNFSEDSAHFLFSILTENMTEKPAPDDKEFLNAVQRWKQYRKDSQEDIPQVEEVEDNLNEIQVIEYPKEDPKEDEVEVFTSMVIGAKMQAVSFSLFKGKNEDLAHFSIQGLDFDMDMKSDGFMDIKMCIGDMVFKDTRVNPSKENKFKTIMKTRDIEKDLIYLTYKTHKKGSDILFVLSKPRLYVNPYVIASVYTTIMPLLSDFSESFGIYNQSKVTEEEKEKEKILSDQPVLIDSSMKIQVKFNTPQICIARDFSLSNSDGIIINMGSSNIKILMKENYQKIKLELKKFSAFKTQLDFSKNDYGEKSDIVQPFNLGLRMVSTPDERKIKTNISRIKTLISYRDVLFAITTLDSFGVLFAAFSGTEEETNKQKEVKEEESSESIELIESKFSKEEEIEEISVSDYTQKYDVYLEEVELTLLNDKKNEAYCIPVVKAVLGGFSANANMARETEVSLDLKTLLLSSYNPRIEQFEPVLEPWHLNLHALMKINCTDVHLASSEPLLINFTKTFIETLVNTQGLLTDLTEAYGNINLSNSSQMEAIELEQSMKLYPYELVNKSGVPIEYWFEQEEEKFILENNDSFSLDYQQRESHGSFTIFFRTLVPDQDVDELIINKCNLKSAGVNIFKVTEKIPRMSIVMDIEYQYGTKYINFRSDLRMVNKTKETICFKLDEQELEPLKPSQSFCVPLNVEFTVLSVRPNDNFEWTTWDKNSKCYISKNTNSEEFFVLRGEEKIVEDVVGKDVTLNFHPVIIVENLMPVPLSYQLSLDSDPFFETSLNPKETREHVYFTKEDFFSTHISTMIDNHSWSDEKKLFRDELPETVKFFVKQDDCSLKLLGDTITESGTKIRHISFYTNYWITNCTGLDLIFGSRAHGLLTDQNEIEPKETEDPIELYDFIGEEEDVCPDGVIRVGKPAKRLFYGGKEKIRIKTASSEWSRSFPLTVTNRGIIEVRGKDHERYEFSAVISPAPGDFYRSTIVRLYPATIFVNQSGFDLKYKQEVEINEGYALPAGAQLPFHWQYESDNRNLNVRIDCDDKQWKTSYSQGFNIDLPDSFDVKLSRSTGSGYTNIKMSIKLVGGTNYVIFLPPEENPTYSISNETDEILLVYETEASEKEEIEPNTRKLFCSETPQQKDGTLFVQIRKDTYEIAIDDLGKKYDTIHLENGDAIKIKMIPDGPTKLLRVSYKNLYEESTRDGVKDFEFRLSLANISVSVIDSIPSELMLLSMETISFYFYRETDGYQGIEFSVGSFQIDNQLYLTPYPVVFYSPPVEDKPFFTMTLTRNTNFEDVQYIPYFSILVQEIDLEIDEIFLIRSLAYLEEISQFYFNMRGYDAEELALSGEMERIILLSEEETKLSSMFYFQLFHMNPMLLNISFMTCPGNVEEVDNSTLEKIFSFIGLFASMERAPLSLNGLILNNPYTNASDLTGRITQHYTESVMKQIYLILGSADFLGNPVSLVSNLGSGVKDFFHEPAKGLVLGPEEFGKGILKGTTSLLEKSVYGIMGTANKLTGTLTKIGETATFDEDYRRERAIRKQKQAANLGEGVVYGVRDFGIGLYKGLTGIVLDPIKGAKDDGAAGFFKGVGKGIVGVVLKPTIGAIDLVNRTTEGIKNQAIGAGIKMRIRPPRYFGLDGELRLYNLEKATGQEILKIVDSGTFRKEKYYYHMALPENDIIILTQTLIIFCDKKDIFEPDWLTKWSFSLSRFLNIEIIIRYQNVKSRFGKYRTLHKIQEKRAPEENLL